MNIRDFVRIKKREGWILGKIVTEACKKYDYHPEDGEPVVLRIFADLMAEGERMSERLDLPNIERLVQNLLDELGVGWMEELKIKLVYEIEKAVS